MLVEETDRTKQESEEYISFMSKKTTKRQSLIISLGDKNKHELAEIEVQRSREENEFKGLYSNNLEHFHTIFLISKERKSPKEVR